MPLGWIAIKQNWAGWTTVLVFAAVDLLGASPWAAEEPQAPAATNTLAQPKPYTRIAHPDTNTTELQIALRRFQSRHETGPDIWLAAVSHVGETNYYRTLQAFLERQALVLFEGVGGPQELKEASRRRQQALAQGAEAEPEASSSLQSTLANSLGLGFQLDSINYDFPHYQNSDLSLEQIQALLIREIQAASADGDGTGSNPTFLALMGAMDGSSWLGAILHVGAKMLGSSPKLKAMTRLMFIEILGQLEGDLTQIQGLPPDMKEVLQVLIRERNKVVVRDLKSALRKSNPPSSIAVLYGAGHMDDLQKRLASELDYHPVEDQWLSAISVQPARAGLTAAEIEMIRGLIKWQMESLQKELHGSKAGQ